MHTHMFCAIYLLMDGMDFLLIFGPLYTGILIRFVLQVGFLYLRYAGESKTLWNWFEPYVKDEEVNLFWHLTSFIIIPCLFYLVLEILTGIWICFSDLYQRCLNCNACFHYFLVIDLYSYFLACYCIQVKL